MGLLAWRVHGFMLFVLAEVHMGNGLLYTPNTPCRNSPPDPALTYQRTLHNLLRNRTVDETLQNYGNRVIRHSEI